MSRYFVLIWPASNSFFAMVWYTLAGISHHHYITVAMFWQILASPGNWARQFGNESSGKYSAKF
jgi:hypothetical protein